MEQAPVTKVCKICGETKEFELFTLNKQAKFGRENTCKDCVKERKKKHFDHKKHRERSKIYYRLNREKIRKREKQKLLKEVTILGENYLKSILRLKFNIPASEATDEQIRLQRESIQLHREYQQLKQQLQ
jgi:superfamily II helicase